MDKTLYKFNSRRKFQVWSIEYDSELEVLIITHGQENGKMTIDRVKVATNKSGRSIEEQADLMLSKRFNDKLHKGYSTKKISKIPFGPMLAQDYNNINITNWPVAIQPKLDGVRCLIYEEDEKTVCRSRGSQSWNHLIHITKDATALIKKLPKECFLDGELYIPGMIQSEISGIIRATKNIHPRLSDVKYCIFDIGGTDMSFEYREKALLEAYEKYPNLRFVASYRAEDDKEIIKIHSKFVRAGFEGSMIRDLNSVYHNGVRHKCLLKLKDVFEEPATVISIHNCKGRESGLAVFEVKNDKGIIYKSRPDVDFKTRKEYYDNKDEYIGKRGISKFCQLSKNGVPLHAVFQLLSDRNFEMK
uniref:DNA ligase n=1 Tax=Pithovirus LCPAC406 TaxID=2506599 RepID=A0A481ZE27_9VIRU|nr:MAG: ATP-dependent DNA ligase [Pithovirus LCPAC406]